MIEPELQRLRDADVIGPLDVHFARTLGRLDPSATAEVLLGAAFASRAIAHGHVCADLRRLVERPLLDAEGQPVDIQLPAPFAWVLALGSSSLCGDGTGSTPLVLDDEARLYLSRYFRYERELARRLRARAESVDTELDRGVLRDGLRRLFPQGSDERQKLAAAAAVIRELTVISGGPGTGKTTTVVRVLALLLEQARAQGRAWPRIDLLAPTGKAAARLAESVATGAARLDCDADIVAAIPRDASTVHRRLGYRPGHPTRFFYDSDNPLPADAVIVDEASMVDLALMSKLTEALRPSARLILLGDKDQLASVEAGAILGDICNTGNRQRYSGRFATALRELLGDEAPALESVAGKARPGIRDCVFELSHNYRFGESSGVGNLARAIGAGLAADALALLEAPKPAEVSLEPLRTADGLPGLIQRSIIPRFQQLLAQDDPAQRLEALGRYRLLAAHRRGPFGSERLNAIIEDLLPRTGSAPFYDGRPILITKNDYQLELFNGDVGVIGGEASGELRAWFPTPDGRLRSIAPARLPPCESCYAMTVHKSQGSEFDRVGLVIPPQVSPILTRELLYTGVTRARTGVTLFGTPPVISQAVGRRVERASGLRSTLWD